MASIKEKPLSDDLSFGARITGVNWQTVKDEGVRTQINDIYQARGLLIFEDMEPSSQMQLELSGVFGALRPHAMNAVPRADQDAMSVVMDLNFQPDESDVFEVDGKVLSGWVPWHYDACYTRELYRGALLRALEIPPEGGTTGFADGIQLYNAISPELRAKFEGQDIVYHPKLMMMNQRFGMPRNYRVLTLQETTVTVLEQAENAPRAVHPAVWKRKSGERVLHVSPWQAAGICGHEDSAGDALLEALCQEIYAKMNPYWHTWKPTDMVLWDNWRFIHAVSGHDPKYARRVHRATIQGDYGLGRFESEATNNRPLEMSA